MSFLFRRRDPGSRHVYRYGPLRITCVDRDVPIDVRVKGRAIIVADRDQQIMDIAAGVHRAHSRQERHRRRERARVALRAGGGRPRPTATLRSII